MFITSVPFKTLGSMRKHKMMFTYVLIENVLVNLTGAIVVDYNYVCTFVYICCVYIYQVYISYMWLSMYISIHMYVCVHVCVK